MQTALFQTQVTERFVEILDHFLVCHDNIEQGTTDPFTLNNRVVRTTQNCIPSQPISYVCWCFVLYRAAQTAISGLVLVPVSFMFCLFLDSIH